MRRRPFFAMLLVPALLAVCVSEALGQGNNTTTFNAGIRIDANGVVARAFSKANAKSLSRERTLAAKNSTLPADMNQHSALRKVSLVRLEAQCAEYFDAGKPIPPEMFYLAGLQRIEYLFVFPETNDVVIAGPAEGFYPSMSGSVVGSENGRPVLRLDDLLVALRSVRRADHLGCSIDPEPGKLSAMTRYINANSSPATAGVIRGRYQRMKRILGMQNVSVTGVPEDSHYARVLVAADYRMKLISLGLEKPGVRGLSSHLSLLKGGGNAIQRWWFTPLYDAFQTNPDHTAFQFNGQRAQLMSQQEFVDAAGNRSNANFTKVSTQRFAKLFTQSFPELAERVPLFGELANLVDLAVLAALIDKEQIGEKTNWSMALFLDAQRAPIQTAEVPKQVASLVALKSLKGGRSIIGLVGGGVTINPRRTLRDSEFSADESEALGTVRKESASTRVPQEHPWWWD
ncbi:MAG: hypothetical protein CMJ48_02590 [Planctomycetaceae bacterium]|nr:hypothetical protein [Planctomycetaceae bacterium]